MGLYDAVLAVFNGPRVLFPDGFSKEEQNIRAVYYDYLRPSPTASALSLASKPMPSSSSSSRFICAPVWLAIS